MIKQILIYDRLLLSDHTISLNNVHHVKCLQNNVKIKISFRTAFAQFLHVCQIMYINPRELETIWGHGSE